MKDIGYTVTENELLDRLAVGELDAILGLEIKSKTGITYWFAVRNGIPEMYEEKPAIRSIVNGELFYVPGQVNKIISWETEDRKLFFLRGFGNQMADPQVQAYARSCKEQQETGKKGTTPLFLKPLTPENFHCVYSPELKHIM